MPQPSFNYTSPRGQCAVMLLIALRDLYLNDGLRTATKGTVIDHIRTMKWFAIEDEGLEPYPSQELNHEPRWKTMIAWARKDAVIIELVSYETRNEWGLTRRGREAVDRWLPQFGSGEFCVLPCFLWSPKFKLFICSSYERGTTDAKRPVGFYRDNLAQILSDLY